MTEKRSRGGRPSAFKPEYVDEARELVRAGFTDYEIAKHFGVDRVTLYAWRVLHPEFLNTEDKRAFDERVERMLFERATGYTYNAEKVVVVDGQPTKVRVEEHVPPSDTAMIFWLKNRRPKEWRDRRELEVGEGGIQVVIKKPDGAA